MAVPSWLLLRLEHLRDARAVPGVRKAVARHVVSQLRSRVAPRGLVSRGAARSRSRGARRGVGRRLVTGPTRRYQKRQPQSVAVSVCHLRATLLSVTRLVVLALWRIDVHRVDRTFRAADA